MIWCSAPFRRTGQIQWLPLEGREDLCLLWEQLKELPGGSRTGCGRSLSWATRCWGYIAGGQHVPASKTLAPQDLQDFVGDFRGATRINTTTSLGPAAPCSISSWKGEEGRGGGRFWGKGGLKSWKLNSFLAYTKKSSMQSFLNTLSTPAAPWACDMVRLAINGVNKRAGI